MNLSWVIARRYLLGKKSTNAINVITWISIIGMAIGTAALLIILSVFNGFESILVNLLGVYNPDLKVSPKSGQYFDLNEYNIQKLDSIAGIEVISSVLEEVAMFEYSGSQEVGYLKGVDENYIKATTISDAIKRGDFKLQDENTNLGVTGIGVYNKLSVNGADPFEPINIYLPVKTQSSLAAPFNTGVLYPSGVFSFGGEEDEQQIITNLSYLQEISGKNDKISSVEIKLKPNADEIQIRKEIDEILVNNTSIKNKLEQDETFLKIMNVERWISFLIAALSLGIISFNLVGSLWMIVLDKKKDIAILKSMGYTDVDVKWIFKKIGVLVGVFGLVLGLFLTCMFYFLQKKFNLISVPEGFLMDAYPIQIRLSDIGIVIITVLTIAYLASLLPSSRASKVSAYVKQE